METSRTLFGQIVRWVGMILVVGIGWFAYQERESMVRFLRPRAMEEVGTPPIAVLSEENPETLRIDLSTVRSLGIERGQAMLVTKPIQIALSGKLFLDPNRLVNVHARFAGEVVRLGVRSPDPNLSVEDSRLRFGDHVQKGQLLAVLWSKEVGDEKSDLVDAISRLKLDEKTLSKLKEIEPTGAVTERAVREAQRQFEADMVDATRAERTLRSWRFTEDEIAAIRAEAERLHANPQSKNPDIERSWAEVNIVSPIDGIIIEHNSPVGDVVDAQDVLFKVADLRRVGVVANLYEDDLPLLLEIPKSDRIMAVRVANDSTGDVIRVPVERIGDVVDPNQHTVALQGWIDNVDGRLRSGQFVTATIDSPPAAGLVSLPSSAVIDQGATGILFVSPDKDVGQFSRRTVSIARRSFGEVWIHVTPDEESLRAGASGLAEGEWVVTSGALSLDGTMRNLQAAPRPSTDPEVVR